MPRVTSHNKFTTRNKQIPSASYSCILVIYFWVPKENFTFYQPVFPALGNK